MSAFRKPGVRFVRKATARSGSTPLDTRTIFIVGPTKKGPTNRPARIDSADQFTGMFGPGDSKLKPFADAVLALLGMPVHDVWVVRAADTGGQGKPNKAELEAALASITVDFGPGTVIAPGLTEKDHLDALAAHCGEVNRVAFVDVPAEAVGADALVQAGTAAKKVVENADRLCVVGPWISNDFGTQIPGSVFAAAQTAQSDALDNIQPIGRQVSPVKGQWKAPRLTDADATRVYEAGVNLIVTGPVGTYLSGFKSLTESPEWQDFAAVRLFMGVETQAREIGAQFIGKPINAATIASWHGALAGLLGQVYARGGLYGEPAEAYGVETAMVNTSETAANRELLAELKLRVAEHVEIVTTTAIGVAVTDTI